MDIKIKKIKYKFVFQLVSLQVTVKKYKKI